MKTIPKIAFYTTLTALSFSAFADNNHWIDKQHHYAKSTLSAWSNKIDHWIGTPDPNQPASASIRIMLDSEWNRYDGYSIKPRIRGKIKLPTLKKHLSLVFGDEGIENQSRDRNQLHRNYREPLTNDKKYDSRQARDDNASLALRWSDSIKAVGINTDLDLGIRAGADIFVRAKASKEWHYNEQFSTRLEQIYRYGINSKHYLRTNFENKWQQSDKVFINNHTFLEYTHDIDEKTFLGNSLYRQQNFNHHKRLNIGFFTGFEVKHRHTRLNYYGPFLNWRQPIYKEWVFIQPEIHYYNDKKLNRKHHIGAFLRLEAIF